MVAELGISLMLLIGAGLLIRSFVRLRSVPPGFNPERVISMRARGRRSPSIASRRRPPGASVLRRRVFARIARLPGVKAQAPSRRCR